MSCKEWDSGHHNSHSLVTVKTLLLTSQSHFKDSVRKEPSRFSQCELSFLIFSWLAYELNYLPQKFLWQPKLTKTKLN